MLDINYWAVLVIVVVQAALGAGYYGALGKPWMAAVGLTEDRINEKDPVPYIISRIASALSAIALGIFIKLGGVDTLLGGIAAGVGLGMCFTVSILGRHYAFAGSIFSDKYRVLIYDGIFDLIGLAIAGAILVLWQ